jgi:hypothetical protein
MLALLVAWHAAVGPRGWLMIAGGLLRKGILRQYQKLLADRPLLSINSGCRMTQASGRASLHPRSA